MLNADVNENDIEIQLEPENEIQVEVVDDTPEGDRGKTPLREDPTPSEDELNSYNDDVQKRINKLTRKMHDERREKERLSREHAEALRIAQAIMAENSQLKGTISWGQGQFIDQYRQGIDSEEKLAKDKYRRAYEAGDSEALIEAQDALNNVTLRKAQLPEIQKPLIPENYLQSPNNGVYNPQYQEPAPARDYKAEDWAAKNPWFGQDEEMTSLAYGLHTKLVNSGFDPASDDYYVEIDKSIRQRFPERFQPARPKKSSPVAPVSRTASPKKVTLTQSALAIAKRLGITPEQYAKQMLKLQENANG